MNEKEKDRCTVELLKGSPGYPQRASEDIDDQAQDFVDALVGTQAVRCRQRQDDRRDKAQDDGEERGEKDHVDRLSRCIQYDL